MSLLPDDTLVQSLHLGGAGLALAKRLLALDALEALYARCAHRTGHEFAAAVLDALGVTVDVAGDGFDTNGGTPAAVVANHPFGLLDGLVLIALVGPRAGDFFVPSNYLLGGVAPLAPHFVAMNSFDDGGDGRANTTAVRTMLARAGAGASLLMFPAGDVSHFQLRRAGVEDRAWNATAARLIRKLNRPILPVYIEGRNSLSYQILNAIDHRLGLLRLPRELLNKRGACIRVIAGAPFRLTPREAACDADELAAILRRSVYSLRDTARRAQSPPGRIGGWKASPVSQGK